ncbi:MAG: hypothetical protein ABW101_07380 [Candidatus Thiodiazotropha sp.]
MSTLISRICDPHNEDRDLLVDELNDELVAESYSKQETLLIIHRLLGLLLTETDQSVCESVLNLLSGIYPSGNGARDIETYILEHIHELRPGALVHALSILSESNLDEREEIFSDFLHSDNRAIQEVARNYLSRL